MRRVLVTGTGGTGTGAGIIRALQHPDAGGRWDVVAVDAHPFSWGLYAASSGALVPAPRNRDQNAAYMDRVREIVAKEDVAAILPGTEPEVALLATRREELPVPVIANDHRLLPLMQDKRAAQDRLAALGLPHIPSYPWDRRDEAVAVHGFPLVVKPMRFTSGSRGLHLVTSQAELDGINLLIPPLDWGVYLPEVQPYIGDGDHEYTVGVLSRIDGAVIDSIVIRRELTGFTLHTAKAWKGARLAVSTGFTQGWVVRHRQVQEYCEDLAVRLGSRGPLNIQLRLHEGEPYAFEIHPRFSGSAAIRAVAGFNEPDILLRHWLDGEDPGRVDYQADLAVMRVFDHLAVPAGKMLTG